MREAYYLGQQESLAIEPLDHLRRRYKERCRDCEMLKNHILSLVSSPPPFTNPGKTQAFAQCESLDDKLQSFAASNKQGRAASLLARDADANEVMLHNACESLGLRSFVGNAQNNCEHECDFCYSERASSEAAQ